MKKAILVFKLIAVILSYAMCITVSYLFGVSVCASANLLTSAPAWVALLLAIPFLIAIAICVVIISILQIKSKKTSLEK